MKNIKIGLKVGQNSSKEYIDLISKHVDFIEIYAHMSCDFEILNSFNKPVTVHIAHFSQGVNFSNPNKLALNNRALKHAIKLADRFNSKKIIFHPELREDDQCTLNTLEKFLTDNYDERLYIENMPYSSMGFPHFAADYLDIAYLTKKLNIKFCLDFAHGFEFLTKESTPLDAIQHYIDLSPGHFHVTDTDLNEVFEASYNEAHLNFGEGNIDLGWVQKMIPDGSWVTIETPAHPKKQIDEIAYLRTL